MKIIATGTTERVTEFPEIPTIAETLPGYRAVTWYAMVAPPQMPDALAGRSIATSSRSSAGRTSSKGARHPDGPGDARARRRRNSSPTKTALWGKVIKAGRHPAAIGWRRSLSLRAETPGAESKIRLFRTDGKDWIAKFQIGQVVRHRADRHELSQVKKKKKNCCRFGSSRSRTRSTRPKACLPTRHRASCSSAARRTRSGVCG